MTCASPFDNLKISTESSSEIRQTASRLADFLSETQEYREFVRLVGLVNQDPEVRRISIEIRNRHMRYSDEFDPTIDKLRSDLEALPAVQNFRRAEAEVKSIFHAVDQLIGAEAGVAFAANAQNRGCG